MISGLCIFHDLMNISSGSRIFQRLQRGHEHVITVSNVVARGYVFTGVCHSVHRGVCVADIPPGRHPPTLGRHPPGQISPGKTPQMGRHPPAHCMLGYTHPLPTACWDIHLLRQPLQRMVCI